MTVLQTSLFLLFGAACIHSAKLPKYISPCKRYAPDLNECVKREMTKILPRILEGDKSLKLPNMKPFKIQELGLESGDNLKLKFYDLRIYGLEDAVVTEVNLDVEKLHFHMDLFLPKLSVKSDCEIDSRILSLPLNGKGPCNETLVAVDFTFDADIELNKRNGKEYIKLKNYKMDYVAQREYYYLANLFNGDLTLGEEMNKILNENWKQVSAELHPIGRQAISAIATVIIKAFFSWIPYNDLLPIN